MVFLVANYKIVQGLFKVDEWSFRAGASCPSQPERCFNYRFILSGQVYRVRKRTTYAPRGQEGQLAPAVVPEVATLNKPYKIVGLHLTEYGVASQFVIQESGWRIAATAHQAVVPRLVADINFLRFPSPSPC